jgi:uncharacterized protein
VAALSGSAPRLLIATHSFEELVAAGDFLGALHKVRPEDRTMMLWSWSVTGDLEDAQLRGMLAGAWSLGTDDAFGLSTLPPPEMQPYELELWLGLFERAGYVSDTDEKLEGQLNVYRGVAGKRHRRGLLWTLSLDRARWFARRYGHWFGNPLVYEATVDARDVLAYIVDRNEHQVVLHPDTLRGFRLRERLADTSNLQMFERILPVVLARATGADSTVHGLDHWRAVARTGSELASKTWGADGAVVEAFAALHDACRVNDYDDPGHGERGAKLARELYAEGVLDLDGGQMEKLVLACRTHTDGATSSDPTVGVCFDADRLDLGRVGIEPAPFYMSTDAGRERAQTAMFVSDLSS